MGLFNQKQKIIPTPEGDVFPVDGVQRPKQADPGGPTTPYRLLGVYVDGKFRKPARFELQIQDHAGTYHLGDTLNLTRIEYQVLNKRHVLVPEDALEDV